MVKSIFGTTSIPHENKKESFAKLESIDNSDLVGRTQKYCQSTIPTVEAKREAYTMLLDGTDDCNLTQMTDMCLGLRNFG